jgi:hypothetical protein
MRKERISLVVIVSLLIIALFTDLSWIHTIYYVYTHEIRAIVGLLIPPFTFITFFPAVPIVYGWITKNEIGAILVGVLPIVGFFIFLILLTLHNLPPHIFLKWIVDVISYGGRLSIIAGSGGYFASKRVVPVAILLGIPWFFIFLSMIAD